MLATEMEDAHAFPHARTASSRTAIAAPTDPSRSAPIAPVLQKVSHSNLVSIRRHTDSIPATPGHARAVGHSSSVCLRDRM